MSTFRRSIRRVKAASRRRTNVRVESRRRIGCEQLESRLMLAASPLQNSYNPMDVNDDGVVAPGDVLIVFNTLNRSTAEKEGSEDTDSTSLRRMFPDVNGDGTVTPMDGLIVINGLNAEGEDGFTMTYTLRTFNEAGTQEISQVGVGQKFLLRTFVRDNRVLGNFPNGNPREGVFAAYLDVKYPAALADVAGTIVHNNTDYGQAPNGNTSVDGVVDGAGSFRGSLTPTGRNEFLLWSLPITAGGQGSITFTGEPTTDPADPGDTGQSPSLDTGVYGEDRPICPSSAACTGSMGFVNATISVVTDIAAGNDQYTVVEDSGVTTLTPSVLANDSVLNPPGGTPTITAVTQGSNLATVTFTAANVTYQPGANFNGTDVFTYTISNGQGATATASVTMTVTPVNDAPVATVPGAQTVAEGTALVFNTANNSRVSFSDPDGDVSVLATLTVNNGQLSVPSTAGVSITGNNTGNVQLTGAISAINTALDGAGLTYQPSASSSGSDTLTVTVNDQGNTGGAALSDTKTVGITIAAVNNAPVNSVPVSASTDEDVALVFSTGNGNALSVTDADAGNSPLSVRLSINTVGRLDLSSTTGLTVTNNGTATVDIIGPAAAISTALGAGVTFTPASGFTGTVIFTMRSDDQGATGSGGAQVDTDTFQIEVLPTTRPRAVADSPTILEDDTVGVIISVLQNDRTNPGTVPTLLSFTQPSTGGAVTLIDNGTPANGTDDSLRFVPTANFFGVASFTYTINEVPGNHADNNGPSTATVNVTVSPINDAPVNTVPGAQSATEDTARVINGISVNDIDAGTANIEVTLSVTNGIVNVNAGSATAANNGTNSVKLTGSLTAVNAALASGVTYTANANFSGSDTLTVTTSDLGNTGTPGALTDTDTIAITIAAVNDPPVNTVPGAQTAFKDQDFVFSTARGNALQIADADAGNSNVQVTLSIPNGTLNLGTTAGVTVTGNGTASVSLTGTVASINAALAAGVTYRPTAGFTGNTTLNMVTSDLGNTGGPAQTDTDTVAIRVEEFLPSTIGGGVFVDVNGNGSRDAAELAMTGVVITLNGQDIFGQVVNLQTLTDVNGRFSFGTLKPGTYTVEEIQPAGMRDGSDTFGTGFTAVGNDKATITIVAPGGVNSDTISFAEIGLEAHFLRASDLLASSAQPDQFAGVVFGFDGISAWSIYRGDGWGDYDNARFSIVSQSADNRHAIVTLTARHKGTNTDRSVTIDSSLNARLIFIQEGGTTVIRFKGRPSDLFAMANGEGEAEMSGADYAQAVDQVMAQAAAEIA